MGEGRVMGVGVVRVSGRSVSGDGRGKSDGSGRSVSGDGRGKSDGSGRSVSGESEW